MSESIKKIISGISEQVGGFLPNLAAAIGVLVVGWIIAKILGRVARLAVVKTGLDNQFAKLFRANRQTDIGGWIGKIVYYIAMLFVFVAFFNVLDLPVVSEPLSKFLDSIFQFAPRAISALVLALIAWGLATIARLASRTALETVDIDGKIAAIGRSADDVTHAAGTTLDRAMATTPLQSGAAESAIEIAEASSDLILDIDSEIEVDLIPDENTGTFTNTGISLEPPAQDPQGVIQTAPHSPTSLSTSSAAPVGGDAKGLAQSLPEAVYWLVLFLFLPAVLGALQMPGLLEPIQAMFSKALEYLPNLMGAAVILAVGFLVAKIVRQVVTNLTASLGVDRLGEKVGMDAGSEKTQLSGILGIIAYATVLLPILVAALNTLAIEAVTAPASAVLEQITGAIPGLIGGVIVLGISFFVAKLISGVATELLSGVGFDDSVKKLGIIGTTADSTPPSELAGKALLGVILLLATMQALPMMGLEMFATHLEAFIEFATQVLVGLAIIGLGVYLAKMASGFVKESGIEGAEQMSTVARVAIIIFAGAIGLERMGLSSSIVNVAFGTLLGGLGIGAAIAFGWGGRDAAKRIIDRYVP